MKSSDDIRSVTELRRNTREILNQVGQSGRPVVLTVRGKAEAVLIDARTFEKHLSASNLARLLVPAEEDARLGRTRSMRAFLSPWRRLRVKAVWRRCSREFERFLSS